MTTSGDAMGSGTPTMVDRWVRLYTRGLPSEVAEARRLELTSDIYEQCAADAATLGSRAVRRAVAGRTARGVVDDLAWRNEQRRTMKQAERSDQVTGLRAAWAAATQAWFAPAAVLCGLFNVGLAVGILLDENSTMPGRVGGPMFLLAFGAAMAIGLRIRWMAGRPSPGPAAPPRASAPARVAVAAPYVLVSLAVVSFTLAAIGSLLAGLVGVLALVSLAVGIPSWRRARATGGAAARSSSLAVGDGLVLFGTLPAFAFFWIVVPAVLALITVVGVVGTGADARARAAAA